MSLVVHQSVHLSAAQNCPSYMEAAHILQLLSLCQNIYVACQIIYVACQIIYTACQIIYVACQNIYIACLQTLDDCPIKLGS